MIRTLLFTLFVCLLGPMNAYASDPAKHYTIAFAQDTLDNDYRYSQVMAVEKAFKAYPDIRFVYSNAKANTALQIQQIEEFIYQGVDLIMTSPFDEMALAPAVSKAYRSGIPVIMVDRSVVGNDYSTHVHPDNVAIASDAAEYMAKKLGYKGRILMLTGVENADVTKERSKGFLDAIAQYDAIEVIQRRGNFLRRDAILAMEELLRSGERFDAIFSQSDSMLDGVRIVLDSHGIDPASILMVGVDYISSAKDAIVKGLQDSSYVYSLCAQESVKAALDILAGKELPKEILLPTQHVTKENAHDVTPIF